VRILFERRWATYVEEHTWHESQLLTRRSGGRVELQMDVGGSAELRTWILSFGSGAEVLEPAALRREVVAELRGALARYTKASRNRSQPTAPLGPHSLG
jgi:predicted DNA-binding transcriptional regulator YafY